MKYYKQKAKKLIYLNSEKNCAITAINSKNVYFEWNISDFQIDGQSSKSQSK